MTVTPENNTPDSSSSPQPVSDFVFVKVHVSIPGHQKKDQEATAAYNEEFENSEGAAYTLNKDLIKFPELNRYTGIVKNTRELFSKIRGIGGTDVVEVTVLDDFINALQRVADAYHADLRRLYYDRYEEVMAEEERKFKEKATGKSRFDPKDYCPKHEVLTRYRIYWKIQPMGAMSGASMSLLSGTMQNQLRKEQAADREAFRKQHANHLIGLMRTALEKAANMSKKGARLNGKGGTIPYLQGQRDFFNTTALKFGIANDPRVRDILQRISEQIIDNVEFAEEDLGVRLKRASTASALIIELEDVARTI